MTPRSSLTRALAAIAAGSLVAIVLAYVAAPSDRWTRALVADISWTWTALFAVVCCAIAWRRALRREDREAWLWVGAGCAAFLAGQLVWNSYELVRRVPPPYPSLADVGFIGIYPCFAVAVVRLLRAQPGRRLDSEAWLDIALVTFTAGTLTYEFFLAPLLATGSSTGALLTSIGWSLGGIVVLWMILLQMLRRKRFPLATVGPVMLGLVLCSVSNVIYAASALHAAFRSGGALDLGWDAGLLVIAAAAALAAERSAAVEPAMPALSGHVARTVAVLVGLAGIAGVAIAAIVQFVPSPMTALLITVGVAIIGVRFVYSLRADRRYAQLLENEVANQTRSLMDSLAAAAVAERNLRLVMEAVPEAILVLDREGRAFDLNPAAATMVAARGEATVGRSVFEFVTSEAAHVARENLAAAFHGEVRRFEVPFTREDGTKGISAVLYAPVREGAKITSVLALARDITDQRRTESQLQQAEKLAAIGQLVSGVAHEINNPAAIISGFAQTMLLEELKPENREMVRTIYDEATRIGRITQNLLAFARVGGKERTLADVNDIVRRTFALRSYHFSTLNVAVTLDLDPTDPKIWANAAELQQLLLNLLINAEQAVMTSEGPRAITTRTRSANSHVRLDIADTGPGIPPEIRRKIFDPFFTTKPEGGGTGLGLSICYGIAESHGGRIWVESEPGRGATFSVVLPYDPRSERRSQAPREPEARPAAGGILVLVVDDEIGLRNALLRFLGRRGIQGQGVGDGAEALGVLKQQEFDAIISDVRMPGLGGLEFLERLRRDRPDLVHKLIFSTGDTSAPETAELIRDSGIPTVTKPIDFALLEQMIRHVAAQGIAGARPER